MTRMQFFRLVEGGGSRKSKPFRKVAAAGITSARVKREGLPNNARAAQMLAGKENLVDRATRVGRTGVNVARQSVKGKHIAGAAAGLAAVVGGGMHLKHKAEEAREMAKPLSRLKAAGKSAIGTLKANPKKAALAAAAGVGGMMFMRKKSKKNKR